MKQNYLITFRSITYAQRGEAALQKVGIPCRLRRTPRELSSRGCGYCLMLSAAEALVAAEILREQGIAFGKIYTRGASGMEERSL